MNFQTRARHRAEQRLTRGSRRRRRSALSVDSSARRPRDAPRARDPGRRRLRPRPAVRRDARRAGAARRVGRRRRRGARRRAAQGAGCGALRRLAARPTRSRRWSQLHQAEAVVFDQALSPAQQRNLERHLGVAGRRPDDADPRDLRRARAEPRRQAPGRAGAPAVPVHAAGAALEPPRAPARRHRHARRPGRGADRARPAHDRRAHQAHQEAARARSSASAARSAARASATRTFRVSLVGYTNAGKSTLFNALVKAEAYAADQLFATLDTTTRQLYLEDVGAHGRAVRHGRLHPRPAAHADRGVPGDAAGGRRCRPAAARRRRASPELAEQMRRGQRVLAEIGAGEVPQILVFNKLDRWTRPSGRASSRDMVELPTARAVPRVFVSARERRGARRAARAASPQCASGAALESAGAASASGRRRAARRRPTPIARAPIIRTPETRLARSASPTPACP